MSAGKKIPAEVLVRLLALKAREPELTDEQLGQRFGLPRKTVNRLLQAATRAR